MSERTATITGARSEKEVAAYLPDNYRITGCWWREKGYDKPDEVMIAGTDRMGWTLDAYVIPRLSSGNMGCRETTV